MEEILKNIIRKLKGVKFALIGTANLNLQGIDINPKDIDLITDDYNLRKIAKIFNMRITNKRGFLEGDFKINNWNIHIASFESNSLRSDNLEKSILIQKWRLKIPCMSLKSDLDFYQGADRLKDRKKIKLIKEKLNI